MIELLLFYLSLSFSLFTNTEDNSTNVTFPAPNITKPFCINKNMKDVEMLIYRYTLVLVQYIIPVFVISFVYIQV